MNKAQRIIISIFGGLFIGAIVFLPIHILITSLFPATVIDGKRVTPILQMICSLTLTLASMNISSLGLYKFLTKKSEK